MAGNHTGGLNLAALCAPPYSGFTPNCASHASYCDVVGELVTGLPARSPELLGITIAARAVHFALAFLIGAVLLHRAAAAVWMKRGEAVSSPSVWYARGYARTVARRCRCRCEQPEAQAWGPALCYAALTSAGGSLPLLSFSAGLLVAAITMWDSIDPAGWCATMPTVYSFTASLVALDVASALCFTMLQCVLWGFFNAMATVADEGTRGAARSALAQPLGVARSRCDRIDAPCGCCSQRRGRRRHAVQSALWCGLGCNFWSRQIAILVCFVGTSLVVMGGLISGGNALDSAEAYNGAANAWATVAPMGTARRETAAVAVVV